MSEARYLYCILEGRENQMLGKIGIGDREVYMVGHKNIGAAVSEIPFKEMRPNMDDISAHQRVVEAARQIGTVLPVKFGIIFKTEEGVKKLLMSSYRDFGAKIQKFKDKDEFGVKIVLDKATMGKIQHSVKEQSEEVKKIKQEISESGTGTSYFLKLKLDDVIKNESLKKTDQITGEIHKELSKTADDNRLMKTELEQVILNSAYLLDRKRSKNFEGVIEKLKQKYEKEGFIFHISGPWAPYSFC